jgi:hypothetical protein
MQMCTISSLLFCLCYRVPARLQAMHLSPCFVPLYSMYSLPAQRCIRSIALAYPHPPRTFVETPVVSMYDRTTKLTHSLTHNQRNKKVIASVPDVPCDHDRAPSTYPCHARSFLSFCSRYNTLCYHDVTAYLILRGSGKARLMCFVYEFNP